MTAAERLVQKRTSVSAGGEAVDELFDEAIDVCLNAGRASASLLQRRLSIGYARAARILDELEEVGIMRNGRLIPTGSIDPNNKSKRRYH